MATNHEHEIDPVEHAKAVKLRYDHRDLPFHLVGKGVFGFFVITVVLVVIAFVFEVVLFQAMHIPRNPITPNPGFTNNKPLLAPLQDNVAASKDIENLRAEEHKKTETYGYAEGSTEKVHIPIERAMEIEASKMSQSPAMDTPPTPTTTEAPTLTQGNGPSTEVNQ